MKLLNISGDIHEGWNGNTSVLFLFLSISASLAVIPLSFIRHVTPKSDTLVKVIADEAKSPGNTEAGSNTEVGEKEANKDEMNQVQPKGGIIEEVKNVLKCLVSPRMALLICFFFFDGYQQVFITSIFTRQVVDVGSVGTIMGIYSIVDVLFSYIHGWLSDTFGHLVVVSLSTVFEIMGIIISWFANRNQNWLNYLTGIVLAISDAGYQTEVIVISLNDHSVFLL